MDTKWLFFKYEADNNSYIKVETVDISANNPDTEMFYYGNTLPNIGATNFSLSADNNGSLITSGINISTISGSTYYFGVRNKNNGNYEWGIKFNDVQYFPITDVASESYNPMLTGNIVKDYLNVTNNWIFFKYNAPEDNQNYIETVDISGSNPNTYIRYFGTATPSSNMGNWVRNSDNKSTLLRTSSMLFTATSGSNHYFAVSNVTGDNVYWGIRAAPLSYSEVTSADNKTYNPSISGDLYIAGVAWNMFKYTPIETRSVVIQTTDQDSTNPDTVLRYFGTSKPNDSFSGTIYDNITNGPLQSMVTINGISGEPHYLAVSNKNNNSYNWGIKYYPRDIYEITNTPTNYNPTIVGEDISGTGKIIRFKYVQPAGSDLVNSFNVIDISGNSPVVDFYYYANFAPTIGISGYTYTSVNELTFNNATYSNVTPVTYYIIAKNRNDENKTWAISGSTFSATERKFDLVSETVNKSYVPTISGEIVGLTKFNMFKFIPSKTDYIKFKTVDVSGTNPDTVMRVYTKNLAPYNDRPPLSNLSDYSAQYDNISGLILQSQTDDLPAVSGSPIYLAIYSKDKETKPFGVVCISAYPRSFIPIQDTQNVFSLSLSGETLKDPNYSSTYSKWVNFSNVAYSTDIYILNISGGGSNIDSLRRFVNSPNNNLTNFAVEKSYNGSYIKYPFADSISGAISYFSFGDSQYSSTPPTYYPFSIWKTPREFIEITTTPISSFNTGLSGVTYNSSFGSYPEILFTYSPSANFNTTTVKIDRIGGVGSLNGIIKYYGTNPPNITTTNNDPTASYPVYPSAQPNNKRVTSEFISGNTYYFSVQAQPSEDWKISTIQAPNRIFNALDENASTVFSPGISGEYITNPYVGSGNYIFFEYQAKDTTTVFSLIDNISANPTDIFLRIFSNKKPDYDMLNIDSWYTISANYPTTIATISGGQYYYAISSYVDIPFSVSATPRSYATLSTGVNFPTPDGTRNFTYIADQTGLLRVETEGGSANPYTFIEYFGTNKPTSDYSNYVQPYCRKESPSFSSRVFVEVVSGQQYYFHIDTYNQYQTNLFSVKLEYFDFIDIDNSLTSHNASTQGKTFKWWNTNGSPGTTSTGNFLFFKFTHTGFTKQEYLIETIDLDSSNPDTQMYYYGINKPNCNIAYANQSDTNIKNDDYNGTPLSGIRIDADVSDITPFTDRITYYFAVKNKDDINCHWGIRATPLNRTFSAITSSSDISFTPDISGEEDFFGSMWLHYTYTNQTSSNELVNIETVDISGVSPDTSVRYYGTNKPSSINIFYNGDDSSYSKNQGYTTFNDNYYNTITGDNRTPTNLTTNFLLDAKKYTTNYFSVKNKYSDNKNWGIKSNSTLYDVGSFNTITTNPSANSYNAYINGNYLFTNKYTSYNNSKFLYFKYIAPSTDTVTFSIEDIEGVDPRPEMFYFGTDLPFTSSYTLLSYFSIGGGQYHQPLLTTQTISGNTYYFAVRNTLNKNWGIKYNVRNVETIDTSGIQMYNPSISGHYEYAQYSSNPLYLEKKLYFVYDANSNDDVVVQTTIVPSGSPADTKMWYIGNTINNINTEYGFNDNIQDYSPFNNLSSLILPTISGQKYYFAVSNKNDFDYTWGIKYNKRKYLDISTDNVLNPSTSGEMYNNKDWLFTNYTHNELSRAMIIETVDVSGNTPDTVMYYFGSEKANNIFSNAVSVADDISGVNTLSKLVFDATLSNPHYFAIANKYNDGKTFGISIHERNFNVIDISATSMHNPSITGESEGSYKWDFFKLNAPVGANYQVDTVNIGGNLANTNIHYFGTEQPNKLITGATSVSTSSCTFAGLGGATYYFAINNVDNSNITWATKYGIITGGGGGGMFTTVTDSEIGYDSYTDGIVGPSSRKLLWMKFIAPSSGFYEIRTTDIDSSSGDTYIYYYGTTEPSDLNDWTDSADDVYGTYAAYTVNASFTGEEHYFSVGNYSSGDTSRWGIYYS